MALDRFSESASKDEPRDRAAALAEATREPSARESSHVVVVTLRSDTVLPAACACCFAPAAASSRELGRTATLIVPYCSECQRHLSRRQTERLSVALAACLVGAALATLLPLVWPWLGLTIHGVIALGVVSAVSFGSHVWLGRVRVRSPHTATGRAVWWTGRGDEFACTHSGWARSASGEPATLLHAAVVREKARAISVVVPLALTVGALYGVHRCYYAKLRLLNLGEVALTVSIDDHVLFTVEPSSGESPLAGNELALLVGKHQLTARDAAGLEHETIPFAIASGASHLAVLATDGYCFWLERTYYGKSARTPASVEPLPQSDRFWTLPDEIDSWFAPNPEPAGEARSTGGELIALRQARCERAPDAVRSGIAERNSIGK